MRFYLLFLLLVAPLLLGSNRIEFWSFWVLLTGIAGLICYYQKSYKLLPTIIWLPVKLYCVVIFWSLLQLFISESFGVIDRWNAFQGTLKLASYLIIFLIAVIVSTNRMEARKLLKGMAIILGGYGLLSLILFYLGNHTLLLERKIFYVNDLTGTFINRNSFATFMGLAVICCASSGLYKYQKLYGMYHRRRDLLFQPVMIKQYLLVLFCLVALILTGSRAGILASFIAFAVFLLLHLKSKHFYIAGGALVGASLFTLLNPAFLQRFMLTSFEVETRFAVWRQTSRSIIYAPEILTGIGLNNFESWFLDKKNQLTGHYHKLHNDWLQSIIELGFPVAFVLFVAIGMVLYACLKGALHENKTLHYAIMAVSGITLVLLHSIVDFSLQIPAVAYLATVMAGMGYGEYVVVKIKKH